MPLTSHSKARNIISYTSIAFIFCYIIGLFFFEIPQGNKETLNVILGIVLVNLKDMTKYYFAESKSTKELK